jgi:hypothetical protein
LVPFQVAEALEFEDGVFGVGDLFVVVPVQVDGAGEVDVLGLGGLVLPEEGLAGVVGEEGRAVAQVFELVEVQVFEGVDLG